MSDILAMPTDPVSWTAEATGQENKELEWVCEREVSQLCSETRCIFLRASREEGKSPYLFLTVGIRAGTRYYQTHLFRGRIISQLSFQHLIWHVVDAQ